MSAVTARRTQDVPLPNQLSLERPQRNEVLGCGRSRGAAAPSALAQHSQWARPVGTLQYNTQARAAAAAAVGAGGRGAQIAER